MMRNKRTQLYIYGYHPVVEAFKRMASNIERLYIEDKLSRDKLQSLIQDAQAAHVQIHYVPQKELDQLAGPVVHQGFVAILSSFPYTDLQEFLSTVSVADNPAVIVLDEIHDPHNVGAIIRSAAAAGISGIIVGKHRQADITGTVFKTSAGAVTQLPIIQVPNINTTLTRLQAEGFWITGLASDGDQELWEADFDSPLAIVIGGEGTGLRMQTRKLCDFTVRIPMNQGIESLNASVAAALIAYEWKRRRALRLKNLS